MVRVHRNLCFPEVNRMAQNTSGDFKNMACFEGDILCRDFHTVLDKIEALN